MKKIFYLGLAVFILYQFLNRYFVMGYPGSQSLNSLEISHAMHLYKAYFEIFILLLILFPAVRIFQTGKIFIPSIVLLLSLLSYILFNFKFTAENRYRQPKNLIFELPATNAVEKTMQVIGVEFNESAKAYPVSYVWYHHQIVDSIGGKKIIVTYCGLCRTGRVFEPYINNEYVTFRLVGINHNNAMFEDNITKSWWSQETGVCIVGKLKGSRLNEVSSSNMSLQKWSELYPTTKIMQPDPVYIKRYKNKDDFINYDENPASPQKGGNWSARTFVIGISIDSNSKAYEWSTLVKKRIINDKVGNRDVILIISDDNKSYAVFENPGFGNSFIRNDTLFIHDRLYNMAGINLINSQRELKRVNAYREYWFSWLYAHPNTSKFDY